MNANIDVAEEATAAPERLLLERILETLDLLVVGGDPATQEPPRRGQAFEQVDHRVAASTQQAGGGERSGGPGADDRNPRWCGGHQTGVRSAVLCSAKNSALTSSAYSYFSGSSKSAKIASTGQASTQASQSMQLVGVDVELLHRLEVARPRLGVDAVDRTDLDARVVLDAAAGDDVGHGGDGTYSENRSGFEGFGVRSPGPSVGSAAVLRGRERRCTSRRRPAAPRPRCRGRRLADGIDRRGQGASRRSSGWTAGPSSTSPSTSKRDPWQGQSHDRSAELKRSRHPRWVHRIDTACSPPSPSR